MRRFAWIVTMMMATAALCVGFLLLGTAPTPSTATTPALLPGESFTASGVPSYLFSSNDTIEYGTPNFNTEPSVQADMAQGIPGGLIRSWLYAGGDGATPAARLKSMTNAKQACMFNLGLSSGTQVHLAWMEKMVTTYPQCVFEFGNEPNYQSGGMTTYQKNWNYAVPKLKALDPSLVIGGPAYAFPYGQDGNIVPWLKSTVTHNDVPSFFTWHDYPCENETDQAQCVADTAVSFAQQQQAALGDEQQAFGYTIPTGTSEYNVAAGGTTSENWGDCFYYQWQQAAIADFSNDGLSFAQQFDIQSAADYGSLDMFGSDANHTPKGQFWGLVAAAQADGLAGSTITIPSSFASCAPLS